MAIPTPTERSILSVITYFDLFSYPLTDWEVWKWMTPSQDFHASNPPDGQSPPVRIGAPSVWPIASLLPSLHPQRSATTSASVASVAPGTRHKRENPDVPTFADVRSLLHSSAYLQERLSSCEGFYYLRGHDENVTIRKDRYLMAETKYKKVLRAVKIFRCLPFIRTIAICNSLAYSNTREDGDLDLFIITDPGKVWTVRFFTAGLSKLFGWRPKDAHARDAVCLSFFLASDQLNLSAYLRQPDDRYIQFWLDQLVPVYGDAALLDQLREHNGWWQRTVPNAYGVVPARRRVVQDVLWSRGVRSVLAAFHKASWGDLMEQRYRTMQLNVLPQALASMANKDSRVVVNDSVLKFHENDRRDAIALRFAEQFAKVV